MNLVSNGTWRLKIEGNIFYGHILIDKFDHLLIVYSFRWDPPIQTWTCMYFMTLNAKLVSLKPAEACEYSDNNFLQNFLQFPTDTTEWEGWVHTSTASRESYELFIMFSFKWRFKWKYDGMSQSRVNLDEILWRICNFQRFSICSRWPVWKIYNENFGLLSQRL